ncbi:HAMP domain-containing sensor histidine kinase [Streptomyces sp. NPDC097619]|uniref:sensor histidine kinase n=1 Tax=Streptomyces sp. NPDC097619 TaxID=3157228 RepID=UPI00332E8DD2
MAATAAVTLVVVGVCTAAFFLVRYELYRQLDLNLTQSARLTAQQNRDAGPGVLAGECRFLAAPACAELVPADPARDAGGPRLLPLDPAARRVAAGTHDGYYTDFTLAGHPARMLTTPFGRGLALQVALRADTVREGVAQAAWVLLLVGTAGVLLAGGLGYAVARTGLAPVARLTAMAERIAATRDPGLRIELPEVGSGKRKRKRKRKRNGQRRGKGNEKIEEKGGAAGGEDAAREDELTRLAGSFNSMLDALEASVTAQKRLVADASHELRTPLTALRTNAELLARADRLTPAQRERASAALGRQLREVTGLVGDLIELARDEEPQQLVEEVRLVPLVKHAVGAARAHWPRVPFTLRYAGPEPRAGTASGPLPGPGPVVRGVPARLTRLLSNLLDNAAKFSPPGLPVEVELTDRGGAPELTVRDHGPGIAEADLPYVFDRFYRADAARALPGSGLGLAMARQIAQAHGAALTAERAPGGGACFRLVFPAGPPPSAAPSGSSAPAPSAAG